MDRQWLAFAMENGVPSLTEASLRGSSLWQYISDASTQHLYHVILDRVRETGSPLTLPFRCDGPDRKRFMALNIRRTEESGLELRSILLREEATGPIGLLDAKAPRSGQMLRMCSWCKKVETGDWIEPEQAVKRLNLFHEPVLPCIIHVTCPGCERELLRQMNDYICRSSLHPERQQWGNGVWKTV